MIGFLLIIFAGVGITNLIVNSSILESFRFWVTEHSKLFGKLVTCMMCSGLWVGFFLGLYVGGNPILWGATISLLSYAFGNMMEYLEISVASKGLLFSDTEKDDKID